MSILKCKMCGGDVELLADKTLATCEYCGCTMTFPKVEDDQRAAAFNRGNHFRRIGEFDKALAVYERIVAEDNADAEAHWCCALCRFGIEYVEDPDSYEWLPTCHRLSYDSFLEDVDYLAAVEYSDGITQRQYKKDAAKIAEVQRGILATSQNEQPFDVFICYKETEENGDRTIDSTLAQDIYYQLTDKGYKVFFARITLEDKVGTEYEPYIFAALQSAKVMLVVGTKPEHLNAVWVKNEWSRYLALIKKDRSKVLLPCYRDMDAYDLPEQLSVLQSYDMSKIGFIQDLVRGIEKIVAKDEPRAVVRETVVNTSKSADVKNLLNRAFLFLEDGNWDSANEYSEKVLDIDYQRAEAYLAKLMVNLHVTKREYLSNLVKPFDDNDNYKKAIRFGNDELQTELEGYADEIRKKIENLEHQSVYDRACRLMNGHTEDSYKDAASIFETISSYKDSNELSLKCEKSYKDLVYAKAVELSQKDNVVDLLNSIRMFEKISGWSDVDDYIQSTKEKILRVKYDNAVKAMKNSNTEDQFKSCASKFRDISGYLDSDKLIVECVNKATRLRCESVYASAMEKYRSDKVHDVVAAAEKFQSIGLYKDAKVYVEKCKAKVSELNEIVEKERIALKRKAEEEKAALERAEQRKRNSLIVKKVIKLCLCFAVIIGIIIVIMLFNSNRTKLTDNINSQLVGRSFEFTDHGYDFIWGYYRHYKLTFDDNGTLEYRCIQNSESVYEGVRDRYGDFEYEVKRTIFGKYKVVITDEEFELEDFSKSFEVNVDDNDIVTYLDIID